METRDTRTTKVRAHRCIRGFSSNMDAAAVLDNSEFRSANCRRTFFRHFAAGDLPDTLGSDNERESCVGGDGYHYIFGSCIRGVDGTTPDAGTLGPGGWPTLPRF